MARVSVGLGLGGFPFDSVAGFWRWVDLAEAGGVDSLWQNDRLLSTAPTLETMTMLAALAGRTRRLKFGMSVLSLAFRDPVLVAKQCATLDVLSDGRLLPAFGIGNPQAPEWNAYRLDTRTRGARTDEALEIIQRLWREDHVTFEGNHFHLADASISPKPVQAELPLWIGGSSEGAIRRTARFGTGWLSTVETPEEVAPLIVKIRAAANEAGRAIDEGHYGVGFPFHFGRADDPVLEETLVVYRRLARGGNPRAVIAIGDGDTIVERLRAYAAAGASKFILRPAARGDTAMIEQTRRLIDDVLPAVAAWEN